MLLNHKGRCGTVQQDQDGGWIGTILFINNEIVYRADDKNKLEKAFQRAVDKYLSNLH